MNFCVSQGEPHSDQTENKRRQCKGAEYNQFSRAGWGKRCEETGKFIQIRPQRLGDRRQSHSAISAHFLTGEYQRKTGCLNSSCRAHEELVSMWYPIWTPSKGSDLDCSVPTLLLRYLKTSWDTMHSKQRYLMSDTWLNTYFTISGTKL